ncbi:MAG: hypothetical protein E7295_04395 [Lachnospiraceae bacterium]|nr:hypothetical protein [Lachnospiraceae bacterium]
MPDLFELFEKTADPRNPCYITYPNRMMLGQMYFKGIAGIVSMQGMTQAFNNKKISGNLSGIMGCGKWKYLPHHVTENEYLERHYDRATENERINYHIDVLEAKLRLGDGLVSSLAGIVRLRWKIENEGFNRQKNWDGDITRACSHDANALKNHYLMRQISDLARQLYEWFFLKRNGIKRAIKNVSPVLLACFGRRLTGGDTYKKRLDEPAFN